MRQALRARAVVGASGVLALCLLTLTQITQWVGTGSIAAREQPAIPPGPAPHPDRDVEGIWTDPLAAQPPASVIATPREWPNELPAWLRKAVDLDEETERPIFTNRDPRPRRPPLNDRHLSALKDIIELNRLDESSADQDYDDNDGTLEPLELGFQLWVGGQLVALSLGADPYSSFGYEIDVLPASIGDLDSLRLLDVHSNRLAELPYEIGNLAELRELRVQHNELAELPSSISRLVNLRGAHLSRNQLTHLPDSIGDLERLEWLYLSDNPLGDLPDSFGNLRNLRALALQHTGIDPSRPPSVASSDAFDGLSVLPAALESLPALDVLYVTGNRLGCVDTRTATRLTTGLDSRVFGLSAQRCWP